MILVFITYGECFLFDIKYERHLQLIVYCVYIGPNIIYNKTVLKVIPLKNSNLKLNKVY